jgi:hypothetical protein
MNKIKKVSFSIYFIFLLSIILQSCDIESLVLGNEISGKATITKTGNDITIITDDWIQYVPVNLSDEYKIDKLRVEFRGVIDKNPNQYGIDKIRLTYIKKLIETS